MKIENAVALVTGANRGIGLAFARELLARGARKVYAGARDPAAVTQTGVQPLRLDVTKPDDVAAAAELASDVTLVINNAGIAQPGGFLAAGQRRRRATHLRDQLLRHVAHEQGLCADSQGQRRRRVAQCVVGRLMGERRRAGRLFGQQVRGLVAHQCPAQRTGGAEDAGAGAAHGLRRYRSHARVRCPEVQP